MWFRGRHSYRRTAGRFSYSFDVPILFEIKVDTVFVVHPLHGMNVLEVGRAKVYVIDSINQSFMSDYSLKRIEVSNSVSFGFYVLLGVQISFSM